MPAKGVIAESSDGQVGILGRVKLQQVPFVNVSGLDTGLDKSWRQLGNKRVYSRKCQGKTWVVIEPGWR